MRILKCDVCDKEVDLDFPMAELFIPERWDGVFDADLRVDVCSIPCLVEAATAMMRGEDVEEESEPDVQISQNDVAPPQRLRRLTPEESSEATGVRIKGI